VAPAASAAFLSRQLPLILVPRACARRVNPRPFGRRFSHIGGIFRINADNFIQIGSSQILFE